MPPTKMGGGGGEGCKFLKILMVSDKTIHMAFRIHKTLLSFLLHNRLFALFSETTLALNVIYVLVSSAYSITVLCECIVPLF